MERCENCVKRNHEGHGHIFCEECLKNIVCSECGAKERGYNIMRQSDYNKNPLCRLCFNHQCNKCGVFTDENDPTHEESEWQFLWFDGILFCHECAIQYVCNSCGGDCDDPCPHCESACDYECSHKCGKCEGTYCCRLCKRCDSTCEFPCNCATGVTPKKGCRDMTKCFTNGQQIRHTIGQNTWIGTYDSSKKGIIYDRKTFSMNQFAVAHYKSEKPERVSNVNAWRECECKVDGKWISTYVLPG